MKYTLRLLLNGPAFNIYSLVCDGSCAMEEFLAEAQRVDEGAWVSIMALLERSANHNPPRNIEKSRDVGGDVFEFKAKSIRVCYFYDSGRVIICTHGFYKPAKKVQNQQIKASKKLCVAYFESKAKGTVEIEKPN